MAHRITLNRNNLAQIAGRIPCPPYDRNTIAIGMVHIGVGGFHRAHQAFYAHKLMRRSNASEWGICGIGLREGDQKIHDVLKKTGWSVYPYRKTSQWKNRLPNYRFDH